MSETMNPYAAPGAVVADVYASDEGPQPVKWLSPKGRVGRLRFLARSVVLYIGFFLGVLVLSFIAGAAGKVGAIGWITGLCFIPYMVAAILLTIQRSHDMDWTGWSVLAFIFIPFAALFWVFKSGSEGVNRFGAPPPPNTTLVTIGGLLLPVLAVIGIAAAVALPAYKAYTDRAKAAQAVRP